MAKTTKTVKAAKESTAQNLTASQLLSSPQLNKGTAFTQQERLDFNLQGLIPSLIETLEEQAQRAYCQYQNQAGCFEKHLYLNNLHNINETLFYKLTGDHLEEMMPIIYTPTVGEAVQKFSLTAKEYRGLYIDYRDQGHIEKILENCPNKEIDLIVVTDGEAILGIGDQGIGGINIAIGKLAVYTLCAKINPNRVLPIQLDIGTNNSSLLENPMYLGWKHKRIEGKQYDEFIDAFVKAVHKKFPGVFLHWEDFGRDNAQNNLARFQNKICTFNDDMQGTGVITLSALLSAIKADKKKIPEQRVVIFGAGAAGIGIADQIQDAMVREGLSSKAAYEQIYILNRSGLITEQSENINVYQKVYAKPKSLYQNWKLKSKNKIPLFDVIKNVKPAILIGCSTAPNTFDEKVVKEMASHIETPIIFPLSNPTSKSEASPADLITWTEGKALIATGSPYAPVHYNEKSYPISQCNNAYAFPGIGLGVISVKASRLTNNMLWAACQTLTECSPMRKNKFGAILPSLADIHEVSYKIAIAVAEQAVVDGVAKKKNKADLEKAIKQNMWETKY